MIRPEFRKILMDQRGAAVILWSCFVIFIAIYLVIAKSILANPRFAEDVTFAVAARTVLWILVFVDLGYFVWWKKRYLTREAILDESNQTKVLRALAAFEGAVESRAAAVVSTYVTRKIVIFAIAEAIAVYGLVLALVGRFVLDQYMLSVLTLVLLALEFPSKHPFEGLVNEVEQSPASTKP